MIPRPPAGHFAPYYGRYIERVAEDDVLAVLEEEIEPAVAMFRELTPEQLLFRYAPDKWSVQQLLGHLVDSERVFQYRALRFARADQTPLPGFEENDYVEHGDFDRRPIAGLLAEFEAVRASTLALMRSFTPAMLARSGVANGTVMGVSAFPWVIAGHQRHHLLVLRERYLPHFDRTPR